MPGFRRGRERLAMRARQFLARARPSRASYFILPRARCFFAGTQYLCHCPLPVSFGKYGTCAATPPVGYFSCGQQPFLPRYNKPSVTVKIGTTYGGNVAQFPRETLGVRRLRYRCVIQNVNTKAELEGNPNVKGPTTRHSHPALRNLRASRTTWRTNQ